MENLTGKQFGPYRIIAPLGEGGMAAVYKAYQPSMERYVALKVLPQQLATEPEFVGRFQQEAKVLAKLQHPHILPVFDFGESEGYTYIVMPFVESGTLAALMHGQPLPLPQTVSIISQVGDALDYAHSRGLVHRDVKPSNILVDERGNCLLTDFGIAKILEGTSKFTGTGGVMGTPAYMSPEQGRGIPSDGRSDIYSLGIVLYELATGRVPFTAETPIAVIFKHIQDPLPLPRALNPNLSEEVGNVILKALAKQPEDRFATAGRMVTALQTAVSNAQRFHPPAEASFTAVSTAPIPVTTKPVVRDAESQLSEEMKSSGAPSRVAYPKGTYAVVVTVILLAGLIGIFVFANGVLRTIGTKSDTTATPQPKQTVVSVAALPSDTPPSILTSPPTISTTPEPTKFPTETLSPTTTPLPATATQSRNSSPRAYAFSACAQSCNGANATNVFPGGTTKIYLQWSYENIPVGAYYSRTWTTDGQEWVKYSCTWPGPPTGIDTVTLSEPQGLRSGIWEITITVNGQVLLKAQVQVEGNWTYWGPAGSFNTCYGKK